MKNVFILTALACLFASAAVSVQGINQVDEVVIGCVFQNRQAINIIEHKGTPIKETIYQ
jgi:hypothetical protein